MSDHTLRNHLTSIFLKLEISNRFDLFTFAKAHHHLLDLDPTHPIARKPDFNRVRPENPTERRGNS